MLPLKPRQCVVLVPDTFLVAGGGDFWLDNVYLKMTRTVVMPTFAFLTFKPLPTGGRATDAVTDANLYVTNATLHGESRGSAMVVRMGIPGSSLLLQSAATSVPLPVTLASLVTPTCHLFGVTPGTGTGCSW